MGHRNCGSGGEKQSLQGLEKLRKCPRKNKGTASASEKIMPRAGACGPYSDARSA